MVLKIVYWATTIIAAAMLAGDGTMAFFPLVLLAVLIVSYLTRPAGRRLAPPTVPVGHTAG